MTAEKLKVFCSNRRVKSSKFQATRHMIAAERNFQLLDSVDLRSGPSFKRTCSLGLIGDAPLPTGIRVACKSGRQRKTPGAASQTGLEARDAFGLETLRSLLDLKFDGLPFVEGLITLGLDGREMHEDVLTGLALYESIALGGVEPLDGTLFSAQF
jgi:hypothetical protein